MKILLRLIYASLLSGIIITFTSNLIAQANLSDKQNIIFKSSGSASININNSVFTVGNNEFPNSASPVISVEPDSFDFVLNEGDSASSILQISNLGSTDLNFNITIENLNPIENQVGTRTISNQTFNWNQNLIYGQRNIVEDFSREKNISNLFTSGSPESILPLIVSDSVGDGGLVDVIEIRGLSTSSSIVLQLVFETQLDPFDFGGILGFDVDQDQFTGSEYPFQDPNQDVGCEYYITYFNLDLNIIDVYDQFGNYIGSVYADYDTKSFTFEIPLSLLGGDDGSMNIAAVVGNNSGPTDWIPDEGHGILGSSWLTVEPISGTVLPGNSQDVDINVTTAFLDGGNYLANILISSNDPVTELVTVPVHLTVIGQPNLIAPDSINFAQTFIGYPDTISIELQNDGSVTLQVSDIASSNPVFGVNTTNFIIEPNEFATLDISFNPLTAGIEEGTLSIFSNDLNSPHTINVKGEGILPPVISVVPDSFQFDLNVGDSLVTQLMIDNSAGLGELYFELTDREVNAPESKKSNPYSKRNKKSNSTDFNLFGLSDNQLTYYISSSEIDKNREKVIPFSNPVTHLPIIVSDPIGDGENADIKEIRGRIFNENLDIEYVFADGTNMSDSLIAVLYLDVDRNPSTGVKDSTYAHDIGLEYYVDFYPLYFGNEIIIIDTLSNIVGTVPFEIIGTAITYSIPLAILGNDDGEMDLVAVSGYAGYALDWAPDVGHATLFADAFWLSENPDFGTIPPGGNMSVEISLNTAQLIGGNYNAVIDVSSNDPVNSFIEIPVTLNLTGIPQISLSTDSLNFGETYIGYHNSLFFSISSVGTDSLIGNITSSNPEFIVPDSSFALPVGDVKIIEVQFHPTEIGLSTSQLIINSNGSQISLTVYCTGQGVIAPNIITSNFPFHFAGEVGDTLTGSFKIYNTGGADLEVEICDEETGNLLESSSDRLFGASINLIYEIDPNNGDILNSFSTPVASYGGPVGLAFSGEYLFFSDPFVTPDIYVLDAENGGVITSYPAPSLDIDGLAFIEPYLYVMNYSNSVIYVLDSQNGSIINTIYPPTFIGGGIDGGNGRLFASDFSMNIYELNPANGSIINSFSSVNPVYGLGFTGERLFAADGLSTIDEYDPDTGNFVGSFSSLEYWALAGGGQTDAEWLTEDPEFVTVPGGDSTQVTITVIPITDGHFTADIILNSNDPDSSQIRIPVVLDVVTGIEDEINLPSVYALYQNYPNPFNPATHFSYDLPEQSDVILKIYNILGEEVATLLDEKQNAGRFNIVWDASHLASGIYLYRFKAGKFVETKKMILMK